MNFVERWLGFSPDGGSGSFEASGLLVAVMVIYILCLRGKYPSVCYRRIVDLIEQR